MTTTLQTNRRSAPPVPAPAPEGIEWATRPVEVPADKRLDPHPAPQTSGFRLSPLAAIAALRRSHGVRHARRVARRPELESVFPAGHPGFELRSTAQLALPAPVAVAPVATHALHSDAIDLDFPF